MSESSVHESGEFRLVAGAGLGEDLVQLAPRCGQGDAHRPGGYFQSMTVRDGDCHLSLAVGEVECPPERFDSKVVASVRITDKD
jgi:hypothetical protein